ncbi:hypothetical protein [Pseudaestuariivita rosea]|uniref:hypothetical protein n=1 Tax=Pseudaestuariivita rosea TaxID=2763263 RepID=UPI001ABA6588|nr:hypothetical protein [Pseudaestuariivita rosea]
MTNLLKALAAFIISIGAASAETIQCNFKPAGANGDWIAEDVTIELVPSGKRMITGLPEFSSITVTDRIIRMNIGSSTEAVLQQITENRIVFRWSVPGFQDEEGTKLLRLRQKSYDLSTRLTILTKTNRALITTTSNARKTWGDSTSINARGYCTFLD